MPLAAAVQLASSMSSDSSQPFDEVSGSSVYLPTVSSTITFATESDALLASLLGKYDSVHWEVIDDILEVIRNAQFDTSNVTFRRLEDYYDKIAGERRSLAQRRTSYTTYQASTPKVPLLVVDLTAALIFSESRSPIDLSYRRNFGEGTLKTMSLVHRSWTKMGNQNLTCTNMHEHA